MQYSPQIRDRIAGEIARGVPVADIENMQYMPTTVEIIRWLGEHEDFVRAVNQAKAIYGEKLLYQNIELSDEIEQIQNSKTYTDKEKRQHISAIRAHILSAHRLATHLLKQFKVRAKPNTEPATPAVNPHIRKQR